MVKLSMKRVYESPSDADGCRVLVDRLWPRGVAKAEAAIDLWLKEVAPSTALRQWFRHDPAKWGEFRKRYRAELKDNPAWIELQALARRQPVTLVYAARDEQHNDAVVLKELLERAG